MVGNYSMIRHIKEYAKENNIPIMVDDGIDFLTTLVLKKKATNMMLYLALTLYTNFLKSYTTQ